MAAFRAAIAAGAEGVEFDVRLTRDGVPVIIHDNSLYRTARLPHRIADLSLSELQHVDPSVPSLEQLFMLFESNNLGLYLELKCDSPAEHVPLAKACCELINEYSLRDRLMIECFDLNALVVVKNIDSEIKTAALFHQSFFPEQLIIEKALAIEASAVALHHRLARGRLVQKARNTGLHIAVWTVDDPAWVERAKATGIDALITNDPAAMLAHR